MTSLFQRLWQASPSSLNRALLRRIRRLSARREWRTVTRGPLTGVELCFEGDSEEFARQMVAGEHDRFFYEDPKVKQAIPHSLCWDVGAHFGYHSLTFASMGATVVAFEPHPQNAARFRLNLGRNPSLAGRIRLRTEALSNHDDVAEFILSDDLTGPSSGSHLANATKPLRSDVYRNFQHARVNTRRTDSLIAEGEESPSVIKIDIEGAELLMLQGARELLRKKKPLLLLEVHHIRLMFHLRPFLEEFQYNLHLIEGADDCASRCFVIAT